MTINNFMTSFKEWLRFQEKTVGTNPSLDTNPVASNQAADDAATQLMAGANNAAQMANITTLGKGNPSRASKEMMTMVGGQFKSMPPKLTANTDPAAVARNVAAKLHLKLPGLDLKPRI